MAARVKGATPWALAGYWLGRLLQVTGLLVTLVAATAFFGTPSTLAMLRMMLVGVLLFIPGWLLARHEPGSRDASDVTRK
jgi:hypothetical protein